MRRILASLFTLILFTGAVHALDFPAYRTNGIAFNGGTFVDTVFENVPYVGSDLVDSLFQGSSKWIPSAQQLRMRDRNGRTWMFTLDNPFASIKGEMFNLTYPVRRDADGLYLPLHPLLRLLRIKFGIHLPLPHTGDLTAAPKTKNGETITGLELVERSNGTLLKIRTTEALKWEGMEFLPHYILKLDRGKLSKNCPTKVGGKGLIQSVTTLQEKGLAQITLFLRGQHNTVEVLPDSSLPGFLVTVRHSLPEPKKPVPLPVPSTRLGGGTIIVDAGHGGHDRGATVKGVEEAVVTLAVAKELKKELRSLGYKVKLTREEDEYKTLAERPKFASDQGGDVFVSLHCNSLPNSSRDKQDITGYTVYILREGESEEDKALARRENQAIQEESGKSGKNEIAPVDWILLEHQLNLYSKQSELFTESIVKEFDGFGIPKYSKGARQAGFFVLVGAYMPAVLFEMGFLTNNEDRRILASKSGQREIARRMAGAIDRFRRH